jgi:hypothetical protein
MRSRGEGRALGGAVLGAVLAACGHAAPPPAPAARPVPTPSAKTTPAVTTDLANLSPGSALITGDRPAPSTSEFPPVPTAPAATPAAGPDLQPGAVQMIQQRLEIHGAMRTQQASGEMDAVTRAALSRFQEANHLPTTGEPDAETVRKLGLDPRRILAPEPGSVE